MNRLVCTSLAKWSMVMVLGAMFLFMLLMNCLTPYVADDFAYRISFYDKQFIETFSDVVHSMYVHCFTMNGRVISHGMEQIFMLMPKAVFNFCNAAVYVCLMFFLYRIANQGRACNPLLLAVIAMAFWYFTPGFGQVALWQVGSLNYLWGLLLGIIFLLPFLSEFQSQGTAVSLWKKILFSVTAIPIGMYTEVTSFIALLLSAILLCIILWRSKSPKSWLWLPFLLGCVGYLILLSMPAEMKAKTGEMSLEIIMKNFMAVTDLLRTYLLPLIIAWLCLLVIAIYRKVSRRRLLLSVLLLFGAIAASYMLIIAAYIPERALCTTSMLLILSCAVLLIELLDQPEKVLCFCGVSALTIVFVFSLITGTYDIWSSHVGFSARETYVEEVKADGQMELLLPCVHAKTKYSAFWDLTDLNTTTTDTWPNNQMSAYYGVTSILGY